MRAFRLFRCDPASWRPQRAARRHICCCVSDPRRGTVCGLGAEAHPQARGRAPVQCQTPWRQGTSAAGDPRLPRTALARGLA
jgi:hypothetical protein